MYLIFYSLTVNRLYGKILTMADKAGLGVNDGKTEYMVISCQEKCYQQGHSMNVEGHAFKRVTTSCT